MKTIVKEPVPSPVPPLAAGGTSEQTAPHLPDRHAGEVVKQNPAAQQAKMHEKKESAGHPGFFGRIFRSVPFQEKINFARHLSVCIRSSMPVLEGLKLIREQTPSKHFKTVVAGLIENVNGGQSLAQSMEHYHYVFGEFFVNMVRVGEASGNLAQSLLYLSQELRKQREIAHKVRSSMIYPGVIFIATIVITAFLTFFIFPKILPVFSGLRVELPFTTKIVIATLGFLQKYGFYALVGAIAFVVAVRISLSFRNVHYVLDKMLLSTPILAGLIKNITVTNFTRSLAVLLKSGMTIIDALAISGNTFGNLVYRKEITQMIDAVKRGESLTRYLETRPKLFPAMMAGMIRVGESTGNLEENLVYLAEYYEGEVNESLTNLTTAIEPLLLLFMGTLVGFVALSIITPIYTITQGLQV